MKIVILDSAGQYKKLPEILERKMEGTEWIRLADNKISAICKAEPDVFISFDLEGFEHTTLADGIYYNLLNCKQIHILRHKMPTKERYLEKPLSIAMFFYCTEERYCEYLRNTFPAIPYLKQMKQWDEGEEKESLEKNADSVMQALLEVIKECGLA